MYAKKYKGKEKEEEKRKRRLGSRQKDIQPGKAWAGVSTRKVRVRLLWVREKGIVVKTGG